MVIQLIKKYGPLVASSVLFGLGAFAVYKMLHGISITDVIFHIKATPPVSLALAIVATAFGYMALVGYDWSALRFIGKNIKMSTVALGSFTAFALSNSIGLAIVSGGAVRYRFYRGLRLSVGDIAAVSTYCAVAFGFGVTVIGFAGLAWTPDALSSFVPLSELSLRILSLVVLVVVIGFVLWASLRQRPIGLGRFKLVVPGPREVVLQLVFTLADILLAAATLYVLLPSATAATISYPEFVPIFIIAVVAGILSHVPGGIGIFEAVILGAISFGTEHTAAIAAALFTYRVIYYFLPLVLGVAVLVVLEIRNNSKFLRIPSSAIPGSVKAASALSYLIPGIMASLTFIAGAALVLNGMVPIPASILNELKPAVPVGLFEAYNVVMGIAGGALIVVANGLREQSRSALYVVLAIIAVAIISLILQQLDLNLAFGLIVLAAILWFSRARFDNVAPLSIGKKPLISIALWAAFALSVVLFFQFAHQDANYYHARWWQFAFDANMPRSLRIAGVSISLSLLLLLFLALRPKVGAPMVEADLDTEKLRAIIANQENADANFALTGDKSFLLSANHNAFVMYGHHGRSFVALGPPVGRDRDDAVDLIDAFIEAAGDANCRPAFYQIPGSDLSLFVDAGFVPSKLGEEAVVDLTSFSLEGHERRKLRQAHNRALRDNSTLEILNPPYSADLIKELNAISDEWLREKKSREKNFSLGKFDEAYLQNFRIAVVKADNQIVAFANILETDVKETVTIDLMRHSSTALSGTMDFLFVALMLALKDEGFRHFSLGMAPLTGLDTSKHPRLWDKIAGSVSRFGGRFYNFEGLRDYKDKFHPEWHSKYLMTWGGMDPLLVASDVNALVSGGLRGAVMRGKKAAPDA